MRRVTGAAVTAIGVVLLAYLSAAPVPYHANESARLRLSWSARPERIEVCRTLSAEELARVAEHMRQRESCEGVFATYALRINVDGRVVGESVIRGAGLRNDRPLYLLRDYAVPPGIHHFQVTLTRREKTDDDAAAYAQVARTDIDTGRYAGRAQREASEHTRRAQAAIPKHLTVDTVISLTPRQVALITFNAERRTLQLHADTARR
jgi:hypothetical protein